ncbi:MULTISPECIES: hypothetical protein [Candidatus Kuenenia]|uniref:hypothetical protein n=1 Tax=Candidatus Kuenenia TaxID=380738 RepID=UPI000300031B|nr:MULTISPECIES: hypothetical protein [Kuenenia]MCF6151689.1 hypothetical protein [Candidatus Kuenenia stuttgartiensis]MCZ7621349.1 hypothetical protein [Candidatus Kuenenia sp.]
MRWVHEPGWERLLTYEPDTLVTSVKLINRRLGLILDCRDAVGFHENIYMRETTVHNLVNRSRQFCLFFHQDFYLR